MKLLLASLVAVTACHAPSPSPPPDASGSTEACANLRTLGCPEGNDQGGCVHALTIDGHATIQNVQCLEIAKTPEDARDCWPERVRCATPDGG